MLESSAGPVDAAELCSGLGGLSVYPRAATGESLLPGWNEIPGARGCTGQSCFRDLAAELADFGAEVLAFRR